MFQFGVPGQEEILLTTGLELDASMMPNVIMLDFLRKCVFVMYKL